MIEQFAVTMVRLNAAIVEGVEVAEILQDVCESCREVFPGVAGAGLLIADPRHTDRPLAVVGHAGNDTAALEVIQLETGAGPCLDAYRSGVVVAAPRLADHAHRWPEFATAALGYGFESVYGVPVRYRGSTMGALNVLGASPDVLDGDALAKAKAIADAAALATADDHHFAQVASLVRLIDEQNSVGQAIGLLMGSDPTLDTKSARTALHKYARNSQRKLSEVSAEVVDRTLSIDTIWRGSGT